MTTANREYEALTNDEAAERLRLIGNEARARCKSKGVDCGTCERSQAAIELAIAALRAPAASVGDAPSDAVRCDPAPNWCRTCGKRPNDPAAVFCSDSFHRAASTPHHPPRPW